MVAKMDRRKMSPVQKAWETMTEIAEKVPGLRLDVRAAPDRGKSFVRIVLVNVDTGEDYLVGDAVRVRWVTFYSWARAARPGISPRRAYHAAKRIWESSPWRIPFVRKVPVVGDPTRDLLEAVAGLPWPPRAFRGKDDPATKATKKLAKARALMQEGLAELDKIPLPVRISKN